MQRIKKRFMAFFLAAAFVVAMLCGLVGAPRAVFATEDEPIVVGLSIPTGDDFYFDIANSLANNYAENYDIHYAINNNENSTQIAQIEEFIALPCNVIIVVPVNPDALASILVEAEKEGITIIVLGNPNINYPKSTIYVYQDYYALGESHFEWILSESNIGEIENIRLSYEPNLYGIDYREGFIAALQNNTDFVGSFEAIPISDSNELQIWAKNWIDNHNYDRTMKNEMVTYNGIWAKLILDTYYAERYSNTSPDTGTGIRALPDPKYAEYDISKDFADAISDAITSRVVNGDASSNSTYTIPFVPGLSQYVD